MSLSIMRKLRASLEEQKKLQFAHAFMINVSMFAVWRLKLLQRNRRQENICIRFYLKNYGKSQLLVLDQRNI